MPVVVPDAELGETSGEIERDGVGPIVGGFADESAIAASTGSSFELRDQAFAESLATCGLGDAHADDAARFGIFPQQSGCADDDANRVFGNKEIG
ncbi:MAG: hypothetical protein R2855_07105 [Thermomicrobiales bacterium]